MQDPDLHCQPFIGSRANNFCTSTAASGRSVAFDLVFGPVCAVVGLLKFSQSYGSKVAEAA